MRRKIQSVNIQVGPSFYQMLEQRRRRLQKKMGFRKNLTQIAFTEMLARSGKLKIPKINIELFKKNVKRKKS